MISQTIERILAEKIFAVIRLTDTSSLPLFVERLVAEGITIIEVTLNSGDALDTIERLSAKFPTCLIGAGTVIGRKDSENAIAAGAKFLVSPVVDGKMISIARDNGIPSFAGAFTPTEVHQAQSMGADFVKIFPLAGIGPTYIKALKGPLPDARYVATNAVTIENIREFFAAGCSAVGLGTTLISNEDVATMNLDGVADRVKRVKLALK
jgi:2-dehydro-3-deoxyphosphogluconate aldolase/(4S)-4-hydroxy-2-oxoglutarate aldolase